MSQEFINDKPLSTRGKTRPVRVDLTKPLGTIMTISGRLKYWNQERGFGIVADHLDENDVILFSSVIRASGQPVPYNSNVQVRAIRNGRGWQATDVISVWQPLKAHSEADRHDAINNPSVGVWVFCRFKSYARANGYGFLRPVEDIDRKIYPTDIFIHAAILHRDQEHIPLDVPIWARVCQDSRGLWASQVRVRRAPPEKKEQP